MLTAFICMAKDNFMTQTLVVFCEDIPHGRLAY
jgi:hypothetical protein